MLRCCLNPITPTYLCNTAAAMNLALFEGLTRHPVTKATASPHQYFVVAAPLPASLSLLSIPYPCYRSPILAIDPLSLLSIPYPCYRSPILAIDPLSRHGRANFLLDVGLLGTSTALRILADAEALKS